MHEIFTHLIYELQAGRDCELVTVVSHQGSTPRGQGAQMLMGAQRRITGTVGGGNVEFQSEKKAMALLKEQKGDLVEYALHTDVKENIGMICGGDVTMHFQYVKANQANMAFAKALLDSISAHEAKYLNLYADGSPMTLTDQADPKAYSLPLPVGERAVIFGAGHCGLALASILHMVGFHVTVVDNRPELLTPERFPQAKQLICGDLENISDHIQITPEDYAVIMTNAHTYDFVLQAQLLRSPMAYLGVIGSRRKKASVDARLRKVGITDEMIQTVHSPIGIEIDAVTPEEIAVSIAGEMVKVRAELRKKAANSQSSCPMHTAGA
ncbi:MAG: xanthine dehydrogenase accessory protein XdhC [Clostridia bacterium]|nr:xanthine dehydrogenase accessory protein XdhC [Clostridia bacterium]